MNRWFKLIVVGIAAVLGIWGYVNSRFDVGAIVDDSVLKDRTFSGQVVEIVSENGIVAYLMEDKTNPIVSVDFMFKNAGKAYDAEGQRGISNLVSSLLTQGSGKWDANEFKEMLEEKAISVSFSVNIDDFSGSLLTLKKNANKAYEMLNLALTKPRFDEDKLGLEKQKMLFAFKTQREHPRKDLELAFLKNLYGEHPYGRNPLGNEAEVARVDQKDLLEFVKSNLTRDRLVVGIAGDISVEEAKAALDVIFAGVPTNGAKKELQEAEVFFDGRDVKVKRKAAQNVAMFVNLGVKRKDIDFYPLYIVNYVFGDAGLTSRLAKLAREDEALTYGLYSYLSILEKANLIMGGFSATAENYPRVVEIVKQEWQKMGKEGISAEELEAAKRYLTASFNLRFASVSGISSQLAAMQRYDLGIDFLAKRNEYIEAVTLEEANRVARKYFSEGTVWVSVGEF